MVGVQDVQGLLIARAETLVPLVVLGFLFGDYVARFSGVEWLIAANARLATRLERKLNRPNRSVATRIYRGMIALGLMLLPTAALAVLLAQDNPISQWLSLLLTVVLFGHGFSLFRQYRLWEQAQHHILALELPGRNFLFADSHAVLRYLIFAGSTRFAVYVLGASLWYVLGGLPAMLLYLTIGETARHHRGQVFGWAAGGLFKLLDLLPRFLTFTLFTLGGLFVPGARPWAVRRARKFHGFFAYLIGVSIGGTLPERELPWAGEGTPKVIPTHLARWLLLEVSATVLLILILSGHHILMTLKQLH